MATKKTVSRSSKNVHKSSNGSSQSKTGSVGTLRIIGGQWRSRKLSFPTVDGLRPTTDRVRETLFNWLAPTLPGANCLDLFTGSGALGLEALSREAGSVTFIDKSSTAINTLKSNLKQLKATDAYPINADSLKWLQKGTPDHTFDIVFIDPPFRCNLVADCITLIQAHDFVKVGSSIYIEIEKETPPPAIPKHWKLHREKEAGQVRYMLFVINKPE